MKPVPAVIGIAAIATDITEAVAPVLIHGSRIDRIDPIVTVVFVTVITREVVVGAASPEDPVARMTTATVAMDTIVGVAVVTKTTDPEGDERIGSTTLLTQISIRETAIDLEGQSTAPHLRGESGTLSRITTLKIPHRLGADVAVTTGVTVSKA